MPRVTLDGRTCSILDGTTILQAARSVGIEIPSLCALDGITPPTSCMVCAVKIRGRSGVVPSCAAVVEEGMVIECGSAEVISFRRRALELLLSDHAGDCEAPCTRSCPCDLDIPEMIRLVVAGKVEEAGVLVREYMPFAGVLGYICPAPCKRGCRRGKVDRAIDIRDLHLRIAESNLGIRPCPSAPSGRNVAVIGAGPAGLSAAFYLTRLGHHCTIFDNHDRPGGNLVFGVPGEVLPARILEAEIEVIRTLSIDWQLNTMVGADIEMQRIRNEFDAVVVAAGSSDANRTGPFGLDMGPRGIAVDHHTFATGIAGVFAVGAAVTPGKMAARAAGQGRKVAAIIHALLTTGTVVSGRPFDSHLSGITDDELQSFVRTGLGVGRDISESIADFSRDAGQCLGCDCLKKEFCDLRRLASASGIRRTDIISGQRRSFSRSLHASGLVHEPGKCICCGRCVAISTAGTAPGLTFIDRGFGAHIGGPRDMLLDEAMGPTLNACIAACPTGALSSSERSGSC